MPPAGEAGPNRPSVPSLRTLVGKTRSFCRSLVESLGEQALTPRMGTLSSSGGARSRTGIVVRSGWHFLCLRRGGLSSLSHTGTIWQPSVPLPPQFCRGVNLKSSSCVPDPASLETLTWMGRPRF